MFYRRKILLALLQVFGNELDKIRLQKLLFLYTKQKENPDYEFVPYKYGCFSFSANADLNALVKKEILVDLESSFKKNDEVDYLKTLKELDQKKIQYIKDTYGNMNANSLMVHTYVNYPFWAIKSIKAKDILTEKLYQRVVNATPNKQETILYTIGYEGISLEEYFLRLIKNDVKILVDVRRNPLSMKYGFSKGSLIKFCNALGIEYIHFPEVGIQSNERQELNCQNDYDKLFDNYKQNNLSKTKDIQDKILNLLIKYKRIALTCFEADICQCHRTHLAEAISLNPNFNYIVEHI
ncbi:hypothetical protein CMU23_06965 [Elizabethkingia anophelis]|nr:hypothetical protein [Elizabethkingia anophelis]MDV3829660.1 hypothetical protein [Elizabethkingia anophelis]